MKCPHCLVEFHDEKEILYLGSDIQGEWGIEKYKCPNPNCKKHIYYLINADLQQSRIGNWYIALDSTMQEKLMMMFFLSSNHQLSKQLICDELWPKKPDASETLYTLVRRIKPIIQTRGNLKIISERGRDYKLSVNN